MSRFNKPAAKEAVTKPRTGDPPQAQQQTQVSWQMYLLEDLLEHGWPPQSQQQTQVSWQMCLLEDSFTYGLATIITLVVALTN